MADALNLPLEDSDRDITEAHLTAFDTRLVDENNGKFEKIQRRAPARQPTEELLMEIENEFLAPSDQFSDKWLDIFQK
jgi:hypothetical protein